MRFPESIQYAGSNETLPFNDQKLVFQLGSKLNAMNKNNPKYAVNFIPWYQSSQNAPVFLNGVRLEDGTVPTVQDMIENPSLQVAADEGIMADELATVREKMGKTFFNPERMGELAADVYRAHKKFIGRF